MRLLLKAVTSEGFPEAPQRESHFSEAAINSLNCCWEQLPASGPPPTSLTPPSSLYYWRSSFGAQCVRLPCHTVREKGSALSSSTGRCLLHIIPGRFISANFCTYLCLTKKKKKETAQCDVACKLRAAALGHLPAKQMRLCTTCKRTAAGNTATSLKKEILFLHHFLECFSREEFWSARFSFPSSGQKQTVL